MINYYYLGTVAKRRRAMKKSHMWISALSIVIIALLSGLCMAATQSEENAKIVASKSVGISTAAVGGTSSTGSQVAIEKVPIAIYRRAANLLEELRDQEPSWRNAHFGSSVNLFYRPDIQDPSYYEFIVEPSGFIMLSANQNDWPIAHFSSTGKPIGNILAEKAKSSGKSAVKFYKLDSLSYVAEDAKGELASNLGDMPMKVSGMDSALLKTAQGSVTLKPLEGEGEEGKLPIANRSVEKTGTESLPIQFQKWESWSELKEGYASNYKVFLEAQRNEAAEEWAIQQFLTNSGEGLFPGDEYLLAMLYPDATFSISGPGKDYISYKMMKRTGLSDALQIQVLSKVPPQGKVEFEVSIGYKNGQKETIKFAVLDPTRVKRQSEDETNLQEIGAILSTPVEQKLKIQIHYGPWSTPVWAGTEEDQRYYCQWIEGGCPIGCGPVAWAMEFCWADHQSWIGADDWDHGHAYPGDAPRYQDDVVEDMIREIHDYVGTYCVGENNAATNPWEMDEAEHYLEDVGTTMGFHSQYGPLASRDCRNCARDTIRDRHTPAIIGTGFYAHYPLAWGYRYRQSRWGLYTDRDVYVNMGWCEAGDGWVHLSTFFCGYVYT
jgi:hypothetical protein